ncbi:MAG: hypothetical protein NVSMB18_10030 [Acetobacteraceae bacterium]
MLTGMTSARAAGYRWRSAVVALLIVGVVAAPCRAQRSETDTSLCRTAGADAEARFGLPSGLLAAIGRVESGRRDPATGEVIAWPWTINANGAGRMFPSAAAAITDTRALRELGTNSIDVGCFQINLRHHPAAFPNIEQAFDPKANATYAASFLSALHQRLGTWETAISAYHSSTPERGQPYRDRVLAGWSLPQHRVVTTALPRIRVVTWSTPAPGSAIQVLTPSAPGAGAHVIVMPAARFAGR